MATQATKAGIFGNNSNSEITHEELKKRLNWWEGILAVIRFGLFRIPSSILKCKIKIYPTVILDLGVGVTSCVPYQIKGSK
jgi:hypothetical protein